MTQLLRPVQVTPYCEPALIVSDWTVTLLRSVMRSVIPEPAAPAEVRLAPVAPMSVRSAWPERTTSSVHAPVMVTTFGTVLSSFARLLASDFLLQSAERVAAYAGTTDPASSAETIN